MAVKKLVSDYKQTDIVSAFKDKDLTIEISDKDFEVTIVKITPFDFINDIRRNKKGDLLTEDTQSSWNSYMILQGLSMKESDVAICNHLAKYMGTMTKSQMYKSLLYWIPQDNNRYNWIKSNKTINEEYVKFVATYFECPIRDSKDYIEILGEKWAEEIMSKYSCGVKSKKGLK